MDSQGNVFVAGEAGAGFPAMNAFQSANHGRQDAFVAKISAAGRLVFSTFVGGGNDDRAMGIAVDASGAAYLTGCTDSTNFPTQSPLQGASGGGQDAFVLKLDPAGNRLTYSTYLGGSGGISGSPECGNAIAVDTPGLGPT